MLPSKGFFKTIMCPYFDGGLCGRPHCHYKHSKKDKQEITSKTLETEEKMNSSKIVETVLSKPILNDSVNINKQNSTYDININVEGKSHKRVQECSERVKSENPTVPSYKPTPIAELKRRHIPILYAPSRTSSVVVKKKLVPDINKKFKAEYIPESLNCDKVSLSYNPTPTAKMLEKPEYNPETYSVSALNDDKDSLSFYSTSSFKIIEKPENNPGMNSVSESLNCDNISPGYNPTVTANIIEKPEYNPGTNLVSLSPTGPEPSLRSKAVTPTLYIPEGESFAYDYKPGNNEFSELPSYSSETNMNSSIFRNKFDQSTSFTTNYNNNIENDKENLRTKNVMNVVSKPICNDMDILNFVEINEEIDLLQEILKEDDHIISDNEESNSKLSCTSSSVNKENQFNCNDPGIDGQKSESFIKVDKKDTTDGTKTISSNIQFKSHKQQADKLIISKSTVDGQNHEEYSEKHSELKSTTPKHVRDESKKKESRKHESKKSKLYNKTERDKNKDKETNKIEKNNDEKFKKTELSHRSHGDAKKSKSTRHKEKEKDKNKDSNLKRSENDKSKHKDLKTSETDKSKDLKRNGNDKNKAKDSKKSESIRNKEKNLKKHENHKKQDAGEIILTDDHKSRGHRASSHSHQPSRKRSHSSNHDNSSLHSKSKHRRLSKSGHSSSDRKHTSKKKRKLSESSSEGDIEIIQEILPSIIISSDSESDAEETSLIQINSSASAVDFTSSSSEPDDYFNSVNEPSQESLPILSGKKRVAHSASTPVRSLVPPRKAIPNPRTVMLQRWEKTLTKIREDNIKNTACSSGLSSTSSTQAKIQIAPVANVSNLLKAKKDLLKPKQAHVTDEPDTNVEPNKPMRSNKIASVLKSLATGFQQMCGMNSKSLN